MKEPTCQSLVAYSTANGSVLVRKAGHWNWSGIGNEMPSLSLLMTQAQSLAPIYSRVQGQCGRSKMDMDFKCLWAQTAKKWYQSVSHDLNLNLSKGWALQSKIEWAILPIRIKIRRRSRLGWVIQRRNEIWSQTKSQLTPLPIPDRYSSPAEIQYMDHIWNSNALRSELVNTDFWTTVLFFSIYIYLITEERIR